MAGAAAVTSEISDNFSIKVEKLTKFGEFIAPGKQRPSKLTTLLSPTNGTMLANGFDPVQNQDAVRRYFGIVSRTSLITDLIKIATISYQNQSNLKDWFEVMK